MRLSLFRQDVTVYLKSLSLVGATCPHFLGQYEHLVLLRQQFLVFGLFLLSEPLGLAFLLYVCVNDRNFLAKLS